MSWWIWQKSVMKKLQEIHNYKDISCRITRSKRKSISVFIERDGVVHLRVPEEISKEELDSAIETKRVWIYKNLTKWEHLNANKKVRSAEAGENYPYLGSELRLEYVDDDSIKENVICQDERLLIRRSLKTKAEGSIRAFYRKEGYKILPARIEQLEEKLGVKTKTLRILELGYRWASISEDTGLNVHWKCMMAPLKIIDYILAHELSHLIIPDHSQEFWNTLDKVMPDYRERKDWLAVNGARY